MSSLIDLPEFFRMLLVDGLQMLRGQCQLLAGHSGQCWRSLCPEQCWSLPALPTAWGLPGIYPSSSSLRSCLRGKAAPCFVSALTLTVFAVSELSAQSLSGLRLNSPTLLHALGMFSIFQTSDLLPCPPLIPFIWLTPSLAQSA